MPKRCGGASKRQPATASSDGEQASSASQASGASPGAASERESQRTFTAPSGKHYVLAGEAYPDEVAVELRADVVSASEGDLLELVLMHEDWVYGKRFKAREDCVNEGVFRLEWVYGVRLTLEKGRKELVEVDIHSPAYGYRAPAPSSISEKLRMKMFRRRIDDVAKAWSLVQSCGQQAPEPEVQSCGQQAPEPAAELAAVAKAESKKKRPKRQRAAAPAPEPPLGLDGGADPGGASQGPEGGLRRVERRARSGRPLVERTWQAQWEQQAAHLESLLSASSSGVEDGFSDSSGRGRPTVQKKMLARKAARSLLHAKRTGELQAIAEEWEKACSEFASKASDMSALNAKVKQGLLDAHRAGDLERLAEEMVDEAERKAAEVKALKERVFRALRDTKRARDLEQTASDMDDAQNELEMRALQIKSLMKKAWKGMVETRRTRELERIADEMAEQLRAKADALKHKIAHGLLRAHRSGELREIRDELEELADSVAVLDDEAGVVDRGGEPTALQCRRRRWAEPPSSDSDSSVDPREAFLRSRLRGLAARQASAGGADGGAPAPRRAGPLSPDPCSDADSSARAPSPVRR